MSFFSIFDNLNIRVSRSFKDNIANAIGTFSFVWIVIQVFIWFIIGASVFFDILGGTSVFASFKFFINGFTLFEYFPDWFRIILLVYIFGAVISIPFTVLFIVYFSYDSDVRNGYNRDNLKINCIDCERPVSPSGQWLNVERDIRCGHCGALMTLTLEDGRVRKLTLKQGTKLDIRDIRRH